MQDDSQLVEVSFNEFSAIMPSFQESAKLDEAMLIIEKFTSDDKQGAFEQALRMFIEALSDDKVDEFIDLYDYEIMRLVANWIST
jgi:hypothetical protein